MKNRVTWVRVTGCSGFTAASGFLGSRVAGSSSWIPPELLNRRISVPVADHGGSGPHGYSGLHTRVTGFTSGSGGCGLRAHRRSRRRRPLVSSAPPTGGSGSISLNSPDLTLNLSALSRSHLSLNISRFAVGRRRNGEGSAGEEKRKEKRREEGFG
jgi:hypothetical protein